MKINYYIILLALVAATAEAEETYRTWDFNSDWRFKLDDIAAQSPDYDDSDWRKLQLPHDWSIESAFSKKLEGCTGYLPGGIGWYRKSFPLQLDDNQVAYLCFDGVYNRSQVWINGKELGFHPFGYSPFFYDITEQVRSQEGEHVVAVRVDHSRYADSRWYTGSGIYRNVELVVTDKLHVPVWGTFVTTPNVSDEEASVVIETEIRNAYDESRTFSLHTRIESPDGEVVAFQKTAGETRANSQHTYEQSLQVKGPQRWSIESPRQYTAVTEVIVDGEVVDSIATRFGIRTIEFYRDQGFFLNGKRLKIKGVCLHHDGGLVGAAVPSGVWRRRLQTLQAAGCNAIRTAHNPPSKEFLDLCDELGLLVQDEFYDEWDLPKDKRKNMQERTVDGITRGHHEFFQEWAESDLKATMKRDRNHPSVFQWSIGNEIEWTYPRYRPASGYFDAEASGNYFWTPPRLRPAKIRERYDAIEPGKYVLAETAKKLADWTREMDTTRPVISNCILPSVSHVSGYAEALDIVGYSYRRVVYDYANRHFPEKTVMGTENLAQWHDWKAVIERPFISGLFLWTGIDYLGEANDRWPDKGLRCGLLDTAGFRKPSYHMMKTLWSDEPHIYMATQRLGKSPYQRIEATGEIAEKKPEGWKRRTWTWHSVNQHWNYEPGEEVVVEVYANADQVELFLNERSLGVKSLSDFPDRIYKWLVPYEPGALVARTGGSDGGINATYNTAGKANSIALQVDTESLRADGYDVAHITAQLVDSKGVPVRNADQEVRFTINGPVKSLGVDNGSISTVEKFQADDVLTHNGRCMLIVQSERTAGAVKITAESGSLLSNAITIAIE